MCSLHFVILHSTEVLCLWQLGVCPWSSTHVKTDWKVCVSIMLLLVMVRKCTLWLRCALAWHNFHISIGSQDFWSLSLILYSQKLREQMKSRSLIINSKGHCLYILEVTVVRNFMKIGQLITIWNRLAEHCDITSLLFLHYLAGKETEMTLILK